jgi:hypothetical protein
MHFWTATRRFLPLHAYFLPTHKNGEVPALGKSTLSELISFWMRNLWLLEIMHCPISGQWINIYSM